MAIDTFTTPEPIDMTSSGTRIFFGVGAYTAIRVHAKDITPTDGASWTTGTLKLRWSLDARDWFDLSPLYTFSAEGLSPLIDVTGVAYVAVEVGTAQSGRVAQINVVGVRE